MKIFMLWDMEGVSGLHKREQVWFWEEGVSDDVAEEGFQLLMRDADAAARAALEAGADEVIVSDTHHGGNNMRPAEMFSDPRVTIHASNFVDGKNRRGWMPGLGEGVDGFMLMGHHAKAGTRGAFLPHTWSGQWADFRINGESTGEMGMEACYAGHWNVPLALVQGDDFACAEAETQFPWAARASVKKAEGHDRCSGLDAEAARRLTGEKVAEAVGGIRDGRYRPHQPELPMTVAVQMTKPEYAEAAAGKPGAVRVDDYTVEARVDRRCDVVTWILGVGPL